MSQGKYQSTETTLDSAIHDSFSELETLKDEAQEQYDNMPDSFQNSSKGEQLTEIVDNLDGINEVELPTELEFLGEQTVTVMVIAKRKLSRAARRDNTVAALRAAVELLEERRDSFAEFATGGGPTGDKPADHAGPWTADEYQEASDACGTLANEIQEAIDTAEAVEF